MGYMRRPHSIRIASVLELRYWPLWFEVGTRLVVFFFVTFTCIQKRWWPISSFETFTQARGVILYELLGLLCISSIA
jgi:hypothetical protein